jgi:NAD(P)H-hydrate repair Nnr-like enzyme with NAD(P)H-hydrate dehydratase domain
VANASGGADPGPLAATAAWLHGHAAVLATRRGGGGTAPITALDVAERLPDAVADALADPAGRA